MKGTSFVGCKLCSSSWQFALRKRLLEHATLYHTSCFQANNDALLPLDDAPLADLEEIGIEHQGVGVFDQARLSVGRITRLVEILSISYNCLFD